MPSSCGKRRSEDLDLEKKKQDNKIRVAVNLHHHAASTCESSSNIRLLVKDLKCLKKGTSTTKLINEIDRCAQRIIEVQSTTKKDICKVAPRGSTSYAYHRMSSKDFFESSPTKVVITQKKISYNTSKKNQEATRSTRANASPVQLFILYHFL